MADNRFQGKKVSTSWDIALTHAQRMGVHFELDSGRRTMAEQLVLWRNYRKYGKPVAAFPNPNAPHIRLGRQAHAIDVNSLDGGESRLQRFLEREGLQPTHPVRGEAWHMEVPESMLRHCSQLVRRRQKKPGR